MTLIEKKMDLFKVEDKYYLAHCISSDCEMGAGIAVEFQKRFELKEILLKNYTDEQRKHPTCILEKNIFNLITKKKYWDKPNYRSLKEALTEMKNIIILKNIKFIAMPKIGCGLDKLQWKIVKEMIKTIFSDIGVTILVCYL